MGRKRGKKYRVYKEQSLGWKSKILWLIVGVVCIVGLTFTLIQKIQASDMFIITHIDTDASLDKRLFENVKGQSLFTVNTRKLYRDILAAHPELQQVRIVKQFPETLSIEVKHRTPFAQLYREQAYLIDRKGYVLSDALTERDPKYTTINLLNYQYSIRRGKQINDPKLQKALALVEVIQNQKFLKPEQVAMINAVSLQALYFLVGNTKVIIGEQDFAQRLFLLEKIVTEKLKGDFSKVLYIDLRYKKVYLGYKR